MRSAKSFHQNSGTVPERSHCFSIPAPDNTLMRLALPPVSASGFGLGEPPRSCRHHLLPTFLPRFSASTLGRSMITLWDHRDGFCRLAHCIDPNP